MARSKHKARNGSKGCKGCGLLPEFCECDVNPYLPQGLDPNTPVILIHPTEWLAEPGNEYFGKPSQIVQGGGNLYIAGDLSGGNTVFELALAIASDGKVWVAQHRKCGWPRFVLACQFAPDTALAPRKQPAPCLQCGGSGVCDDGKREWPCTACQPALAADDGTAADVSAIALARIATALEAMAARR